MRSALVYDPVLRMLHWVNAFLIFALLLTGLIAQFSEPGEQSARLHEWHGLLGAGLVCSLLARLAWGIFGPVHARFADMWNPTSWLKALAERKLFESPTKFGHHSNASLVYLSAYALLIGLAVTGLMMLAIKQGLGPLSNWFAWHAAWQSPTASVHEFGAWAVLGFVGLHLTALALHPLLHHIPVAQSMINGIQYLPEENRK